MAISAELGEALEAVVNDLVANGRYHSKSEVLREGVRLVQEPEAALARLGEELDRGMLSAETEPLIPVDQVFADVRARLRARSERPGE
jgi:antitoxin ParD1/3/4